MRTGVGAVGALEGVADREGVVGRAEGVVGRTEGVIGRPEGVVGRPEGVVGRDGTLVGLTGMGGTGGMDDGEGDTTPLAGDRGRDAGTGVLFALR